MSELLEGKTLRELLGSTCNAALPLRKATEYALQIAHGLAAAHGKGITRRDLHARGSTARRRKGLDAVTRLLYVAPPRDEILGFFAIMTTTFSCLRFGPRRKGVKLRAGIPDARSRMSNGIEQPNFTILAFRRARHIW